MALACTCAAFSVGVKVSNASRPGCSGGMPASSPWASVPTQAATLARPAGRGGDCKAIASQAGPVRYVANSHRLPSLWCWPVGNNRPQYFA